MAFTSTLYPNEIILHDGSPARAFAPPKGAKRGLRLELRTKRGYAGVAPRFPKDWIIPKADWQGIIQEREERKARVSDRIRLYKSPCKDQAQTLYCWINAPTRTVELCRLMQNQEHVLLSPASAGAPIKGFRNVGGWGKEGLEWIIVNGLVPVAHWPANAIDRRYYTEENKKLALKYRVTEWMELTPRSLEEQVSFLFRFGPYAAGFDHWSHEVTALEPVWLDGTVSIRHENSWGPSYGENGLFIMQGSKMLSDDSVAPLVATAS